MSVHRLDVYLSLGLRGSWRAFDAWEMGLAHEGGGPIGAEDDCRWGTGFAPGCDGDAYLA